VTRLNGNSCTDCTLAENRGRIDDFLEKLRNTGNVRLSCEAAGIPRRTAYYWRNKWATFEDAWNEALDDACDRLQAEAWRRAIEEGSDRLLMFLLKAHRSEVYNPPQRQEITGSDGGPLVVVNWDGAEEGE